MKKIIVTGGAGFIGSALIRHLVKNQLAEVLNLDKLTYAGNLASLKKIEGAANYHFVQMDICDPAVKTLFAEFRPDAVMHLAAESHVDRSIDNPLEFIETNVMGTANLLHAALGGGGDRPDGLRHESRSGAAGGGGRHFLHPERNRARHRRRALARQEA